jgi:glucose/arabinose dehydrogenase
MAAHLSRGLVAAAAIALATTCGGAGRSARPTPTPSPAATTPPASPGPAGSPPASSPARPAAFDAAGAAIRLEPFLRRLDAPLYLTDAGDGTGTLYVVEQAGRILAVSADGRQLGVFLDIRGRVLSGGERGLLGLAFHPDYERNGRFFVNYTARAGNGDTIVSEFRRAGPVRADPASERVLLRIDQPFANHNGGWVDFGPDGFLYIGTGDGGSAGDPMNNGQRLDTLLGKILRIDVDRGRPYAIPPGNPFVSRAGARPEIFDYGLRNPWRASFDRVTRDLFIGDVGQASREEIDVHPASARPGLNFGWRVMEGSSCFRASSCDQRGLTLPVAEYRTSEGCAVTGGYVYRGSRYPSLVGGYFFADFCNGRIHVLSAADALRGPVRHRTLLDTELSIASFGEDEQGELYVVDLGGSVWRLAAA